MPLNRILGMIILAGSLASYCVLGGEAARLEAAQPPKATQSKGDLPLDAVARLGKTRLRHAQKPTCVVFAPDGKSFITGAEDGAVRVWSVETGELLRLRQKPGFGVSSVHITHGGKRIAANFNADGIIRMYDASTLKELDSIPFSNRDRFGFTADGAFMISSDLMGNAVVTETANDLPKLELTEAELFDFQPDGKAIAVGNSKGSVIIHKLTGGKPLVSIQEAGKITGLLFHPNGKRLAVGSREGNGTEVIHIYEPPNKKPIATIAGMSLPHNWVGDDALACSSVSEAGVYSFQKQQWLGRIKGISGEFAFSPDGTKLVATGNGLRVRLWDLTTSKQLHAEDDSFPDPVVLVASEDGRTLFLMSGDTAYNWQIGTASAKQAGRLPGSAVAATTNNDTLLVATADALLVYHGFDPAKPHPEKPSHVFKDSAGAKAIALSANGKRVAWALEGGKVFVADIADKQPRREVPSSTTTVLALGFNPKGDRLGVLGRSPFLRMWDVSDALAKPEEKWNARVQRGTRGVVAFSPDGKYVTAVSTTQLLVFEAADGKDTENRAPLHRYERYSEHGPIQHASFSPDGRLLIVGSGGTFGRLEVWEVATRGLVRTMTTGYGGTSRLCVFPDGTRVASAGAEEAVTVWNLRMIDESAAPKASEILTAIKNLGSEDASIGYPAVKLLAASGKRGTDALALAVKELIARDKKVTEWIEDLGSDTFDTRELAKKELLAQGSHALPALSIAAHSDDPEIRGSARELLTTLNLRSINYPEHGMIGDVLTFYRIVIVLEEIGSAEAKSLLMLIADVAGKPGEEAKAALARFKQK